MSDLIEDLYYLLETRLHPTFLNDPEYQRRKAISTCLEKELAADLGPTGGKRLDEFLSAEFSEDHFLQLDMFRHTLALGLELGRLTSLTVSAPRRCGTE